MRIKITAGGIYDGEGRELPLGTEVDVADFEVDDEGQPVEPHPWGGRFVAIGASAEGKEGVNNLAEPPAGPYEARDKGEGWWAIYAANGEQIGKSIRKDDAEAFNIASDEDKAAYVAESFKA